MADMKTYVCARASKKTGKVDKMLEGIGKGLLQLWALQNTTKSKQCVIYEKDSGLVVAKYIGTDSGFPEIHKNMEAQQEYVEVETA